MTKLGGRKAAIVAVAMFWLGLSVATARADDQEESRRLYQRYCSACHGESGKGDGVVSQSMRPKPSDLTLLAKRSAGGTFARADIAGRIDGRETSRVHGDPDMPVWGEILRDSRGGAETKILLITGYLETIQAK